MVGVVFDASNIVVKDGLCLGKGDSMLAEVRPLFVSVPIEGGHSREDRLLPFQSQPIGITPWELAAEICCRKRLASAG